MFRRYRIELIVAFLLGMLLTMGLWSKMSGASRDAMEHDRADRVLMPAFISAMNDFNMHHQVRESDHLQKMDAGDMKRWRAARKAWKDLEEAMNDAGF
jgi:hypothetical protein